MIGIISVPIWIWIGVNMEIRIRMDIKAMPIRNTGFITKQKIAMISITYSRDIKFTGPALKQIAIAPNKALHHASQTYTIVKIERKQKKYEAFFKTCYEIRELDAI
jgi:hypothetical protein